MRMSLFAARRPNVSRVAGSLVSDLQSLLDRREQRKLARTERVGGDVVAERASSAGREPLVEARPAGRHLHAKHALRHGRRVVGVRQVHLRAQRNDGRRRQGAEAEQGASGEARAVRSAAEIVARRAKAWAGRLSLVRTPNNFTTHAFVTHTALPNVPWQLTGNHWLALPCIHPADGAIYAVGVLHRGARAAVEFAGSAGFVDGDGPPLLKPVIEIDGVVQDLSAGTMVWERAAAWLPTFTCTLRDVVVRGTVFAPYGRDADVAGAVYVFGVENRGQRHAPHHRPHGGHARLSADSRAHGPAGRRRVARVAQRRRARASRRERTAGSRRARARHRW